ncbi:MAG TPA: hypothetical protein VF740_12135, partial [Candidatus Acidoferrum sp.]
TQLGGLDPRHLGVIARTSAMQYKDAHKDAAQVARELGVNYLLEGSIRRAGQRVRITAQLIQSSDQTHLWASSYDRELSDVLKLQSEVANAHLFYSNSYLSPLGRHDLAIAEMKQAVELDPLSISIQSFVGITFIWARRYDEAIVQLEKANQMNPAFALNHERLAHCYLYMENFDDAIREETKARLLAGEEAKMVVAKEDALRKALAAGGSRGYWQKLLELSAMVENPPEAFATPYGIARIYAQLGETEKALESLEKAYLAHEIRLTEMGIEPALDPLRSNPRFQRLLRRTNLTP